MTNWMEQRISYYLTKENKNSTEISIEEILKITKSGDGIKDKIIELRAENDKVKKDAIKSSLPMVTFSGLFGASRKKEALLNYSNLICLDLDKLIDIEKAKQKIESDEFTFSCFLSPSGNGLKVLIKVIGNQNVHHKFFNGLQDYYRINFNIEIDKACKDISRGAFLSFDPNVFVNPNSVEYGISNILRLKMEKAEAFLSKSQQFKVGNRNNYVFEFANLCNAQKIDLLYVIEYSKERFIQEDFLFDEIESIINSAFSNNYSTTISKQYNNENKVSNWEVAEEFIRNKYEIRYNVILNKAEYKLRNSAEVFMDINEDSIYRDMQKNNVSFSLNKLRSLLASDFIPKYNPFLDYFENVKNLEDKDEIDHIDYLASFVKTDDIPWFRNQFKKMLVRSVACALDSEVFNKQVFILVHSEQNSGKSTFCRFICPPSLSEYFTENIGTDKDSLIALTNNFIINMDELSTLNRAEINTMKSMISRRNVNVRLPYGRRQVNHPRRANFVGSTNKDEFLTDETGSVRWQCFELIDKIDFTYKEKVNINLVWKQAYKLYLEGFDYELTKEEIQTNEIKNRKYQKTLIEYDLISNYFKPCDGKLKENFKTATEILSYLKNQDSSKSLTLSRDNVCKALKQHNYKIESCYIPEIKQSRKGYFIKTL
jgi:hypothetical protein